MPLWYHKTDSLRWLTGSIRQDLIPDERSVWADLMAMAALTREERRGYIERSEGIPYDKPYLLNFLNISEELFDRAVAKCVKEGRLQMFSDGTMFLTNWGRYNDVTEFENKKAARQGGIERAKANKNTVTNAVIALTRAVNILNKRVGDTRYAVVDGQVLDTQTGVLSDISEFGDANDKS